MGAETLAVSVGVLREQARALLLWSIAVAAVCAMYISFYPSMGGTGEMQALIDQLPDALVAALGYEEIATAGGWLSSTVYGLLGPALLLVFAIGLGARLVAGQEEDGSLELEYAAPITRDRIFLERWLALFAAVLLLVVVATATTALLVVALDMEVGAEQLLAGSAGLFLLTFGFGTLALAVGAAAGRRAVALGAAAGLAVLAFMLDALGPVIDADWMSNVSPFSWYMGGAPLVNGFDLRGLALLAIVPIVSAGTGLLLFRRRDLMV